MQFCVWTLGGIVHILYTFLTGCKYAAQKNKGNTEITGVYAKKKQPMNDPCLTGTQLVNADTNC